jgi:murein DD-endopeptidase MepM/ murein hydrolase activator NlpD
MSDNLKQRVAGAVKAATAFWKKCSTLSASFASAAWEEGYRFCYKIGMDTVRRCKRLGRVLIKGLRPVGRLAYRGLDKLLLRHLRTFGGECRRVGQGFALAGQRMKAAYERHPLLTVPQAFMLPVLAFRRHRKLAVSTFNLLAPVAAALVLVATLNFWSSATFALSLEVDGQSLGYIADESVYDAAANMANGRVINADNSFSVERVPKLTLAVVSKDDILDENAVCDMLLSASSDSLAESSGLYVDGEFIGALTSRTTLDTILDKVLDSKKTAEDDRTSFVPDVEIVDGLYPVSVKVTPDTMDAYLSRLPVQVASYITYEETIPYASSTVEVASQMLGYRSVKTKGKDGAQTVTAEVVTVDGVEQSRTVISTVVTKEAVDEVIAIGGKKYNDTSVAGDGKATGTFIWPLPATKQISSPFASRWGGFHGAIDISNGRVNKKPIVASDGGRVVEAGWHYSYGYYVLIDHGNGYKTRYAHCSSLNVKVGQKVAQGEYIANVGNTGNSTGPHLHFEVIKKGKLVNPLDYVKR